MCQLTEILNGYPKKHGITIEELAEKMGYECSSTLARHLNPNDEKRPFPAAKLLLICKTCNNDFTALDHLNERAGRIAFPIPKIDEDVDLKSLSNFAKTSSKALSKMAECLEDGRIDSQERKDLVETFIEHAQRVNIILAKLNK